MTPRERVEAVLLKKRPDRVPFTVYESLIPVQCETERRLRNEGLCIVRRISVLNAETPDVIWKEYRYKENGITKIRTEYTTPYGDLFSIGRPCKFTTWSEQKIFQGPQDYKAIEFMIRNNIYSSDYEPFLRAQRLGGSDVTVRAEIGYEPLQEIIYTIMGVERFCTEWADNRDEVLKLHEAIVADRKKRYEIVAQSPALYVNYGGNICPEILGPERFEKYILPHYQECAEIMHKHGKLVGTHLDGNSKIIAPLVATSGLDYVEAFNPLPDGDMSVKEALEIWPEMVLWINFPSSVHLASSEVIEKVTLDILEQAVPGDRLIIGITEDVPEDRWQESFSVISRVLNTKGRLPLLRDG